MSVLGLASSVFLAMLVLLFSLVPYVGTELEFILFNDTYESAHDANYTGLTPANQYNVDYSILGTTRVEPLLRQIRNVMYDAGLDVEGAKGECNFGQQEIGFLYAEAMVTATEPPFPPAIRIRSGGHSKRFGK